MCCIFATFSYNPHFLGLFSCNPSGFLIGLVYKMRKTHKNNNSINCDNLYTIHLSKTMIGYTDNMKNNKGEYIMSKVKQWAEDTAEQKVDSIISQLKDGQIDLDTAKVNILNTENKQMLGINSENVDEIINMELASANVSKSELKKNA